MLRPFVQPVACCCAKFKPVQTFSYAVVASVCTERKSDSVSAFFFPVYQVLNFKTIYIYIYIKEHNYSFPLPTKYRPFSGSLKPLLQSVAKYEAIDMRLFFILMQMKLIITRKGFSLGLVLKVKVFETRKWPF